THTGPAGWGANHPSPGDPLGLVSGKVDDTGEPNSLVDWEGFHREVENLPEAERDVFDLVWYAGLTQQETANLLNVCVKTVKRAWHNARKQLRKSRNKWSSV